MAAVRDSSHAEFEIFNAPTHFKSNVWKHFGFYKKDGKLNKTQVICKECRASKPYNGSTTNMIIHLKRKHDIHTNRAATPVSSSNSTGAEANPSTSKTGVQLTCSTLSLMVPTLRLMSAFAWQVVQHCNVVHYGKVEELVQLVTEVVPHLLSDTEKVHLLLGLKATEEFPEADLLALVWEFISRLDTLLPLPDIKQTAELLSAAPSLLEECGQLEFEPDQLKTLLDHHTQQRNAKECSWVQTQSQGTTPSTASSPQSKPQQNCSNIQRCRRSGRKLSPHRTEEDKDRQSDNSLEEEEGAEGKQSDEEWLPVNDHIIEEEEGAEGKQSDEEWVPENCSKTKRKKNINKDLKEGQPIISSSVRRSARPVYTCSLCSMEFTTKRALTKGHMRTHTLPFRCDICDERYPFKAQLTNHWHSMHTGVDLYTEPGLHACPQRSSSHSQEDTVLQHIRQEHTAKHDNLPHSDNTAMKSNERPIHRCSYCGLEFKRFWLLKSHVGIHTMPFHCDLCDKRYGSNQGLIQHRRFHTGERPFTCSHCGRGFKQMAHLKEHMRTHTGEHYTCHICGKKSIQRNTHKRHMLTHTGVTHKGEKRLENNYLCTECGRAFKQMAHLKEHMRTHTGEHRYTCHICGKKSIQHHTHVRHMRMHKGEKNYLCTECGKAFLTKGELGKHTRWHTGERPHVCKLCGKRFVNTSELTKHIRIHTGEKPYSCTHCPKAFLSASKLKQHMFIHLEKKPFACSKCGKGFTQRFNRTVHMRTCKK